MNKVFKMVCIALCLSLILPCVTSVVMATDTMPNPDMSLNVEEQLKKEIIDRCFAEDAVSFTTAALTTDASKYIPDGATLLCNYIYQDNIFVVDYVFDNVRYIVEYFKDGTIQKSAKVLNEEYILKSSTTSDSIQNSSVKVEYS